MITFHDDIKLYFSEVLPSTGLESIPVGRVAVLTKSPQIVWFALAPTYFAQFIV